MTERVVEQIDQTGFEQVGLLSLSSADYSRISDLVNDLAGRLHDSRTSISLPSLRADAFSVDLADAVFDLVLSLNGTITFGDGAWQLYTGPIALPAGTELAARVSNRAWPFWVLMAVRGTAAQSMIRSSGLPAVSCWYGS